jgi:hypothetical protein
MGADTFKTKARGATAELAFADAIHRAQWSYGHDGYTGTIAEKHSFVMIRLPEGKDPSVYAEELIDAGDPRIDDKWGPAGCIQLDTDTWLFFGWASS